MALPERQGVLDIGTQRKVSGVTLYYRVEDDVRILPAASFLDRGIALFVDLTVLGCLGKLMGIPFELVKNKTATVMAMQFAATIILSLIYYSSMQKKGQSPGKKLLGIRVIKDDGSSGLTMTDIFMREGLGRILTNITLGIGYLMAIGGTQQALHDRIAKTRVVRTHRD